jgi:hypothetical protein
LLVHDIEVAGRAKIEVARDTFNALANTFPVIADRPIYRELTEQQSRAT